MNMIIIERSKMNGSNISVSLSLRNSVEKDYDAFRFRIDGDIGEWITFNADKESIADSTIAVNFQCPATMFSHKIEAECLKDGEWVAAPYVIASSNISPNLNVKINDKEDKIQTKESKSYHSGCPVSPIIEERVRPLDASVREYRNPNGGIVSRKRDGSISVVSPLVLVELALKEEDDLDG